MTKHEIVDLVCKTYNLDNRGANEGGSCFYLTPDGKTCAVGMTLIDPKKWEEFANNDVPLSSWVQDLFEEDQSLWEAQKEEFRGHGIGFWQRIQKLHDEASNWTNVGISEVGLIEAEKIKRLYV